MTGTPADLDDVPLDALIVGGGLVGLSLAVALEQLSPEAPLRIGLVEAGLPPRVPPSWDERCIALNDGSRHVLQALGLWDAIAPHAAAITATHISERGRFGISRFSAAEAGLDALGHNTPLRALGEVLLTRVQALPNVRLFTPATVIDFCDSADEALLTIEPRDGARVSLRSRLLLAADGAQSTMRRLLNGAAEVRDYAQSAIVTAVRVQRPLAGVAYERFTPEGPFALLPKPRLADGGGDRHDPCSLIWTLPTERAATLAELPDEAFLAAAQNCFGERAGRFLALGRRIRYPLSRSLHTHQPLARTVFCGNAAQSLHPVAAQGFNLALRDVFALRQWLDECRREGRDPGAPEALAAFADQRKADRQRTADFTDQLVRLFSNRTPVLHRLRHWGLLALDLTPPAKQAVLRQNLGHRGLAA